MHFIEVILNKVKWQDLGILCHLAKNKKKTIKTHNSIP